MANPTCRSCDRSADAGAHCSSRAAGIMATALNPFYSGRCKNRIHHLPVRHFIF